MSNDNYVIFSNSLNVFILITFIAMLYVRSYNLKNPSLVKKAKQITPLRVMISSMLISDIVSAFIFYPSLASIIEAGLRPLGAGLWYLIIVGILSLFRRNKHKINT